MRLALRRIYYSIVIVLFLITASLLVLYSTGYRYDWQNHKIFKTGALSISTLPKNSNVYLDQMLIATKTPTMIKNLKPKKYELLVAKDEYWPWTKSITIMPARATFFGNITLIKKDSPFLIEQGDLANFVQSPNQEYIVYFSSASVVNVLKVKDGTKMSYPILGQSFPAQPMVQWSADNNQVLLSSGNDQTPKAFFLNINSGETQKIENSLIPDCQTLSISNQDSGIIFCLASHSVYRLNPKDQSRKIVINRSVQSIVDRGENLFFIENTANHSILYSAPLENPEDQQELVSLPKSNQYLLDIKNPNILLILDKINNKLYLVVKEVIIGQELIEFPFGVSDFAWSDDFSELLLWNEFEIWLYNAKEKNNRLITRVSTPIKSSALNFARTLAFYCQAEGLTAIELNDHEGHYLQQILTQNCAKLFTNSEGQTIFFTIQDANQPGIYSLNIHDRKSFNLDL